MRPVVVAIVLLAAASRAHAYPQFQLSKDQTCTSCHISPAGGGILSENGLAVTSTLATYDGPTEPLHGLVDTPKWFLYSGDVRFASGLVAQHGARVDAFPMQGEIDLAARGQGFTAYATIGAQRGSSPATYLLLREHYVMWQQDPDATTGLYVRAGRFMPVYGLRLAEHNLYTRRYGQTPLYGETYGVAAEYIQPAWEVHATGFVHDPLQDPIERGNGGALYAEARAGHTAFGAEGRYAKSPDDARLAGGLVAKQWLGSANLLLQGEVQLIRQTFPTGPARKQLVSTVMASYFIRDAWLLDVALGQFDEDLAVMKTDLEAVDANLHWFATPHWELLLTNRLQTISLGGGGATSGYSLVQVHYRI